MRAHIVRSRGQVAVHGRTPAVAARMPPAVLLVINLRIGTAAGKQQQPAAASFSQASGAARRAEIAWFRRS